MAKDIKHKLEESLNLVMQLEALDFKNIKPYNISNDKFDSAIGSVNIEKHTFEPEELELLKMPPIVQQSLDFYKNKPTANTDLYNIGYDVEGSDTQYTKSSYKELVKILYTVMLDVKKFIEDNKPFGIVMFTASKDEASGPLADDPQKLALYKYIVSTNIPKGYTIADVKFLNKKGIIVYRKTLNK